MAVKFKIILVVSIVLLLSISFGYYFVSIQISSIMQRESTRVNQEMLSKWQAESNNLFARYRNLLEVYKGIAVREASLFVNDKKVIEAYEIANRGNLEDKNDPESKKARKLLKTAFEDNISGVGKYGDRKSYKLHFHTKNIRSLARMWRDGWQTYNNEEKVDVTDDISLFRNTLQEVKKTSNSVSGVEIGRGGFFVRGVCPILRSNGDYIGSVEFAVPLTEVTDSLTEGSRVEHAVYMPSEYLKIAEHLRDPQLYPLVGTEYVQVSNTNPKLSAKIINETLLDSLFAKKENIIHGNFYLSSMPIQDFSGDIVGILIIINNIEDDLVRNQNTQEQINEKDANFKLAIFIGSLIAFAVILLVIYIFLSKILTKLAVTTDELQKSEEKFRSLFTYMLDGFALHKIILDDNQHPCDYLFEMVNPAFEEIMGCNRDDIIGKTVLELMPTVEKSWISKYGKVALTQEPIRFEDYSEELDKHFEVYSFSPMLGHFACVCKDITLKKKAEIERARMQEEILYTEKMRVVGQLAGGVAHDINNTLGGIIGSAELLKDRVEGHDNIKFVNMILESAERAADISMNLLTFGNKNFLPFFDVNIEKIIKEAVVLIKKKTGESIVVNECYKADAKIVHGDHTQLFSSIVNILINAYEAIEYGGVIEVETNNVSLTEKDLVGRKSHISTGDYIEIVIRDTGCGIKSEDVLKVFEPFFSTKDVGGGLGLSAVLGAVEHHGGEINIESEFEVGTSVVLRLPCLMKD